MNHLPSSNASAGSPAASAEAPPAGLLQLALDGLLAHVCLLDRQGRILLVNRAWREFALRNGAPEGTVFIGSNYLAVCEAASGDEAGDARAVAEGLRRVLAGAEALFEYEYPCHSMSELRWFGVQISRVELPDGPGAVVAHHAVTAQRLNAARLKQRQTLETMGTLAGGMAHDFNNVLGAILGNAALALDQTEPGLPAAEALRRIQLAGQRAREVVRRILAVSRGHLQPAQVQPLRPLIEETMSMLRLTLPPEVELRGELAEEPLWACVDATELQQALLNLAHNARHALVNGTGRVTLGLAVADPPEAGTASEAAPQLRLWVSDTGSGMSEKVRAYIFEPYFTTRGDRGGTGLGLAQVQQAVQRAGGRIEVQTRLGAGSCFDILLPRCAEPDDRAMDQVQEQQAQIQGGSPARVLLVDDDEVVGITLEALLERAGHQVTRVNTGAAALQCLARTPADFDLLITDQTMPHMTGLELCRAARLQRADLPLLLVSGTVDEKLAGQVRAMGHSAVVAKEEAAEQLLRWLSVLRSG
ncbi:MAG: response regulator [Rubrivivax sp.]|nr:response regulator [Rubrivivax sp.]